MMMYAEEVGRVVTFQIPSIYVSKNDELQNRVRFPTKRGETNGSLGL